MQAAVGVAQLQKLGGFVEARRRNFAALREGLRELEEFFILPEGHARTRNQAGSAFPLPSGPKRPSRGTR